MVQYCPALTGYHEPAMVQSMTTDCKSWRGQAGHQLPGAAPVLLQGLGGCQEGEGAALPPGHDVYLHNER